MDMAALESPDLSNCALVASPTPIAYEPNKKDNPPSPICEVPIVNKVGAPIATPTPPPTTAAPINGNIVAAPTPMLKAAQSKNDPSLFSSCNISSMVVIRKSTCPSSPSLNICTPESRLYCSTILENFSLPSSLSNKSAIVYKTPDPMAFKLSKPDLAPAVKFQSSKSVGSSYLTGSKPYLYK